jgi:hypothetical protein
LFENSIVKRFQNGGNGSPMGYELMKVNRLMQMLLIFLPFTLYSAVDRIKVELSTGNYYGIFPNIPLGLTAAITVTQLKQQLFCVWFFFKWCLYCKQFYNGNGFKRSKP